MVAAQEDMALKDGSIILAPRPRSIPGERAGARDVRFAPDMKAAVLAAKADADRTRTAPDQAIRIRSSVRTGEREDAVPAASLDSMAAVMRSATEGNAFEAIRLLLGSFIGFDRSNCFIFLNNDRPVFRYDSHLSPFRSQLYDVFIAGVYKLSPYWNSLISVRAESGFYTLEDVMPDDFSGTVYYDLYYANKAIVDEGMFYLQCEEGGLIYLIERSHGAAFSETEIALLRRLLPLVQALLAKETSFRLEAYATEDPFALRAAELALSRREREVAKLLLEGHSSKSAARSLGISPHTERVHRKRLYRRLAVTSHIELFRKFYQPIF